MRMCARSALLLVVLLTFPTIAAVGCAPRTPQSPDLNDVQAGGAPTLAISSSASNVSSVETPPDDSASSAAESGTAQPPTESASADGPPAADRVIHSDLDTMPETLSDIVGQAEAIVEATVIEVSAPRWNTEDGEAPPGEFDFDNAGFIAIEPVRLAVLRQWKGDDPDLEGILTFEVGGGIPGQPIPVGAAHGFAPGQTAIAFLSELPSLEMPIEIYLNDQAAERSAAGSPHRAMIVDHWFPIEGDTVVELWQFREDWPLADLEAAIEALVADGGP
jgi:hypothetical protein